MTPSRLEETLAWQMRAVGLAPESEYRFHPGRRWRADFAFPAARLLIEVEGGVWTGGRHTRGAGFTADCTKYNAAALLGYRTLRFTADMIDDGSALGAILEILNTDAAKETA